MARRIDIYSGQDPRGLPLYTITEAGHYLHISPTTLRSWVQGRPYPLKGRKGFFAPLIRRPDRDDARLSFINLIEAHVLRALRTRHSISIKAVRTALDFAQQHFGVERLLASPELRAAAGELFLDKYGQLISLTRSGQLALKKILEAYLERVQWDRSKLPSRLFPFVRPDGFNGQRSIAIDPRIAFGQPVILSKGIATAAIVARIDAGETVGEVAEDYALDQAEVEQALIYERAA